MNNREIARQLSDYAHFLQSRGANMYRVRAYRKAAETMLGLPCPASEFYETEGRRGLRELPGIGSHLSYTIESLIRTGQFHSLEGSEDEFFMTRCLGCG